MHTLPSVQVESVSPEKANAQGTFVWKEIVVAEFSNPMRPNMYQFKVVKANYPKVESLRKGDQISLRFVMDGREWNPPTGGETKYFTTMYYLGHDLVGSSAGSAHRPSTHESYSEQPQPTANSASAPGSAPKARPETVSVTTDDLKDDDLPF